MKALIWIVVVAVVAVGGYYLYSNYMATDSSDATSEESSDGTSADASADVSL